MGPEAMREPFDAAQPRSSLVLPPTCNTLARISRPVQKEPLAACNASERLVRALPADELLELCFWSVSSQFVCEDEDCPCETLSCYAVGRFVKRGQRPPECQVKAARAELKRRCLCHCCGGKLVPIGDARINGARHRDWQSRRYHKKCWLAARRGEFGLVCGVPETDVE